MLLQPKGNSNVREQFHVPSGIGKALILTGVVEEVIPPVKATAVAPTSWAALQGAVMGQYPPCIRFKCTTCNQNGTQESVRGTAHQTAKFVHCGKVEHTPDAVAEQYVALWNQYRDRGRQRR